MSGRKSSMLCIVYVSEGVKKDVLRHLTDTAMAGGRLAHSFPDAIYGRTSFFLTGDGHRLADRAVTLCNEAFKLIDYRYTSGTHPALGSVDHVCFQPLGTTTLVETAHVAREFSRQLYEHQRVPIFHYGQACIDANGKGKVVALRDVRRQLGYFDQAISVSAPTNPSQTSPVKSSSPSQTSQSNNRMARYLERVRQGSSSQEGGRSQQAVSKEGLSQAGGGKAGFSQEGVSQAGCVSKEGLNQEGVSSPALGSVLTDLDACKGVTMVGAVPFIQNFNMRFRPLDARSLVVQVTAAVREQGAVEALTLPHNGGAWEVACNLHTPSIVTPALVLERAQSFIRTKGLALEIQESYTTGPTEEELLTGDI